MTGGPSATDLPGRPAAGGPAGRVAADEQPAAAPLCSIGRAAEAVGVSTRALRYYEQVGLVRPTGHTSGGHRLYADADLARVARIRELQDLMGFNLEEIRQVLTSEDRLQELRAEYHEAPGLTERAKVLEEAQRHYARLTEQIDDKLARLQEFRAEVAQRAERAARLLTS